MNRRLAKVKGIVGAALFLLTWVALFTGLPFVAMILFATSVGLLGINGPDDPYAGSGFYKPD